MNLKNKLTLALAITSLFSVAHASTMNDVRDTGVLNVGNRQDSIPYSQTADGGAKGYSVDICNAIGQRLSEKLGKSVKLQYQEVSSANRIPLVANHTIALECGSTTITEERKQKINFMTIDKDIVVPAVLKANAGKIKSFEDFRNKKVIVVSNTTGDKYMAQLNTKGYNIEIVKVKDYGIAFESLSQNRGIAVVSDKALLLGQTEKPENKGKFAYSDLKTGDDEVIGIGYPNDDAEFSAFIQETDKEFKKNGTYLKLREKWFNQPVKELGYSLNYKTTNEVKDLISVYDNGQRRGIIDPKTNTVKLEK